MIIKKEKAMKKIFFVILVMVTFAIFPDLVFADEFIAKVDRFGMESSYATPYVEISFSDVTSGSITSGYYYVVPVNDNSSFPYLFAILSYAKTRNKAVRIIADETWTRGDGYNSFLEIHYAQFAE